MIKSQLFNTNNNSQNMIKRFLLARVRRLSLIKICFIFLFTTFLFTAYLYGLIEVDSHRLVINIVPVNPNEIKNDYDRNLIINLNENIIIDESNAASEKKHNKQQDNSNSNNNNKKLNNFNSAAAAAYVDESDKNITNFFLTVERHKVKIKKQLRKDEIAYLSNLKQSYENLIYERHEKIKSELKKELDRLNKADNNNDQPQNADPNNNNNNKDDDDDDDDDDENKNLKVKTLLSSNELITRDVFVKLLKLEKIKRSSKHVKTVKELLDKFDSNNEFNINELPEVWRKYFVYINELQLYNNTEVVNNILKTMATSPVANCNEKERGTQIKLLLLLSDGTDVIVKPMKVPRDYETPPDHFYFVDFERHHAEIAAFHVDRLLGFNRVPPTVGRVFNMTTELWDKAESELAKTFFYSPAGNVCFTGHCSYYCDSTHAICGRPKDRMEGSVQLMLPSKPVVKWLISRHPYRRTYTKRRKAEWEVNDNYCFEKLFQDISYHSKLMLDLMDMSIFDFITSNMDRHHYEQMITLGNDSFPIHLDNGRSFGKIFQDEMSILAPVKQCCLIRYSTYNRLRYLYLNKFSKLLDESLKIDPLYPILTKNHLKSVDRRLAIIFKELISCSQKHPLTDIIVDDGY